MSWTPDFPPREETSTDNESREFRKRIISLLSSYMPRQGGEGVEGSAAAYATEVTKILNLLLKSKQANVWPKEEDSDTWPAGEEIHLAYFDEDLAPHVSGETITVPERPAAFLDALDAFRMGRPWEDVLTLNAFDPEIGEKELSKSVMSVVNSITTFSDATRALEYFKGANITTPKIRTPLLVQLDLKIEHLVLSQAATCSTLTELLRLSDDVKAFFRMHGGDLTSTSSYDALDARASKIALALLEGVKTKKAFDAASKEIAAFEFSYQDGPFKRKVEDRMKEITGTLEAKKQARTKKGS